MKSCHFELGHPQNTKSHRKQLAPQISSELQQGAGSPVLHLAGFKSFVASLPLLVLLFSWLFIVLFDGDLHF